MAKVLWDSVSNGYLSAAQTAIAGSSMNGLTDGSAALGSAIDNSAGDKAILSDWEFLCGGSITPTSGGHLKVWLLRSVDGGSNYEDGSNSGPIIPARAPDLIIPIRAAAATHRAGRPGVILPPGHFKTLMQNKAGVTLSANNNNALVFRTYAEAVA